MTPIQQPLESSQLEAAFSTFDRDLQRDAIETILVEDGERDAHKKMESAIEEARNASRFLSSVLKEGDRVLEIGAGLGILSAFLTSSGYEVVSVEPGGQGYEINQRTSKLFASHMGRESNTLPIAGEDIDPETHGTFDVIFSINVIEHVADPVLLLERLHPALRADGTMFHLCPNYRVPYEPHFGIPLVPVWPQKTERFLSEETRESGLWKSLNWIDAGDVQGFAEQNRMTLEFKPSLLVDALNRLAAGGSFAERHSRLASAAKVLTRLRIDRLINRVPPEYLTPMAFVLRHQEQSHG